MTTETKIDTRKFVALLQQRITKDGAAWYSSEDLHELFHDVPASAFSALMRGVKAELGRDVERLKQPEKTLYARALLKESNGVATPEVNALWKEKFGQDFIPGPIAKSARIYLGLEKEWMPAKKEPTAAEEEVAVPAEMREALNMVKHVEDLQKKINDLDASIDALEQEKEGLQQKLDVYKPVMAQLRQLAQAIGHVRSKANELV